MAEPTAEDTIALFSRHATKFDKNKPGLGAEHKKYPGLTESGVELARQRARDIAQILEGSEPETILFLAGTSNIIRTKSTAEIYGDELSKIFEGRGDYLVLKVEDLRKIKAGRRKLLEIIHENPNKKIVITDPMFVKQFSDLGNGFADKEGNIDPYYLALEEKYDKDGDAMIHEWVTTKGVGREGRTKGLIGPNPTEVGKNVVEHGLVRAQTVREKSGVVRKVIIGFVGQSWSLDAGITYAAKGKVDWQSFQEVTGGHIIEEAELAQISIGPDGYKVKYRDKEFERPIPTT